MDIKAYLAHDIKELFLFYDILFLFETLSTCFALCSHITHVFHQLISLETHLVDIKMMNDQGYYQQCNVQ